MPKNKPVLICDLDNTLYDWVGYFVPAIYALVEEAAQKLGIEQEQLLDELREVHQRHSDSEHPFALLETKSVKLMFGAGKEDEAYRELNKAFHAFNSARKRKLTLFPDVTEVLSKLRQSGITILAHTESRFFAAADRIHRLGLTDHFERIYCREETDTSHPDAKSAKEWLQQRDLRKFIKLPAHDMKPEPRVLFDICRNEGVEVSSVIYIGDSVAKDVMMARNVGATAVWAKYGANHDPEMYRKLVRISHWTDADVERELRIKAEAATIQPDHVCEFSIREVLELFPEHISHDGKMRYFA